MVYKGEGEWILRGLLGGGEVLNKYIVRSSTLYLSDEGDKVEGKKWVIF